uniref:NADH-ubiquinone oxidoreductase chain 4 n=1 Tax=Ceutorhynchus albosuturalis TaxID=342699 RepID=A0AA51NHF5_9CUCU|nr:NADH dehydrogenase subunit 4 [Ceutorhynchus albosuturalis]
MMMNMMGLLCLMPLVFMSNYWFIQLMFLVMSFIFMMKMNCSVFCYFLSYFFGIDLLSFSLIMLSFWICLLMIMASEEFFKKNYYWELFLFMMVVLMISLFLTFSSMNFFIFYLFFEISIIPTLFLVIGWGNQPDRLMAGIYLLFYTLLASLPMMVGIFFVYKSFFSLNFYFFKSMDNWLMYFCINMVFFIKIPMFFIHLWLPKAHVEAPISGSMILAGIMLKLGGYGLFRSMKLFIEVNSHLNMYIIVISLVGGMIISMICLRQSDMKSLIAYSSVSHMGLVLSGILVMNLYGYWGALVLMLAHGLCSSGLFCLANMSYERTHSRSIYINKGMMNILPSFSLWWFLLCSSNMAAPPSLNLFGEILLMISLVAFSKLLMFSLCFMAFYSAAYSLFLYAYTQHGSYYAGIYSMNFINIREYFLLFLHWVPLNLLILNSDLFTVWI